MEVQTETGTGEYDGLLARSHACKQVALLLFLTFGAAG